MSYNPISFLNLKSTQISILSSSINDTTTAISLGTISDSSVVSITAQNGIVLPGGRSYFLVANLNYSQSSGSSVRFVWYNFTASSVMSTQGAAYSYYLGPPTTNTDTYDSTMMVVVSSASSQTIQIRKNLSNAVTSIIENNANLYLVNSSISIFYTD
jgi:hypothetical protein